jgi:site-specific DNA-adenine methylase
MASDLERELLASDNETLASNLDQTSTQSSVSATHSTMNTTNTEQVFQQLGQFLDSKLVQKLASFKRSFDEREDLRASQLKTPKLRVRLNSKVIRFNMNSMWRR